MTFGQILENKKIRDILKVVLLLVWLGVIFYFSSLSSLAFSVEFSWEVIIRKWAHFFEYAVLMFLSYKVISLTNHQKFARNLFWAFIFTFVYAVLDEYHQTFVPGRHGQFLDVMIDSFGALVSSWLLILEREHQENNPQKKHLFKV